MRAFIIAIEIAIVVIILPIVACLVWERHSISLVEDADVTLGRDTVQACNLYRRAKDFAHKNLELSQSRINLCEAYGIGATDTRAEITDEKRKEALRFASHSRQFMHSISVMPRIDNEKEHQLWIDAESMDDLRERLVVRLIGMASNDVVWAQKELAQVYTNGKYVVKDTAKAFQWWR